VSPEEKNTGFANSVGELFRNKRESKKVSLNEAHQDTRMSIDVLKALENDDFGSFESEIYLKGFIKNYASYLDIEPEFALQILDGQRGDKKASRGTTWDIEETVKEEKIKSPQILSRFIVPALVIIIVILAILLMMERRKVKELQSNLHRVGQAVEMIESGPA